MEKDLQIGQKVEFAGTEITEVLGGFGEGKRGVLAREIAEIHGVELRNINRNINNNRKRFRDNVDVIDLKSVHGKHSLLSLVFSKQQVANMKNIYLLSERGYAKLIKIMDDDKSWEVHDALVDGYFQLKEDNIRLAQDNTELHKIAVSEDEQKEREYQADKVRYGWQNIRTVLENCDYRAIEDEVAKVIDFHANTLKKRDRANYDSHKEANNTEYKQLVRDRVFNILDDITNTTLDGVLRAVTSELRVNVIKDKIGTINRSNGRIQSNLQQQYKSVKPPSIDQFHKIDYHPFSINYAYEAKLDINGDPQLTDTPAFSRWKTNFPYGWTMPSKKELNVDFNEPIRIHFYYDHLEKFDRSNFDKSAQDMIFDFYQADDQIVWETGVSRTNKHVDSYSDGKIYFHLENI